MRRRICHSGSSLRSTRTFVEDGVNGYLVDAAEPGAHAAAIVKILRDSQLAGTMGRAGQSRVSDLYSWQTMESRLCGFYEEVLT